MGAAERGTLAMAMVDEHRMHDYAMSMLAFAAAARPTVHRGDLKLELAKVYWATGDHSAARHLLREIDDILLRGPKLGVLVDAVAELR